jgi:hypothetical protein
VSDGHALWANDFSWIEDSLGIKGFFDFPKNVVEFSAIQAFEKRCAHISIAVLTTQSSPQGDRKIEYFVGENVKQRSVFGPAEIEEGLAVNIANTSMPVD